MGKPPPASSSRESRCRGAVPAELRTCRSCAQHSTMLVESGRRFGFWRMCAARRSTSRRLSGHRGSAGRSTCGGGCPKVRRRSWNRSRKNSAMGYRTISLQISASDVGAPHLRARVFVLAYANSESVRVQPGWIGGAPWSKREGWTRQAGGRPSFEGSVLAPGAGWLSAKPRLGGATDGCSRRLDAPWPAGRGEEQFDWEAPRACGPSKDRRARLKALGNAVVPQQAREAMRWALGILGW